MRGFRVRTTRKTGEVSPEHAHGQLELDAL